MCIRESHEAASPRGARGRELAESISHTHMLISFGRVIRILLSFLLVRTLAKRAFRGGGQSHINVCLGSQEKGWNTIACSYSEEAMNDEDSLYLGGKPEFV